jgi:non-ribosomal peptide synthetase component E (peptide arylation enzyme)
MRATRLPAETSPRRSTTLLLTGAPRACVADGTLTVPTAEGHGDRGGYNVYPREVDEALLDASARAGGRRCVPDAYRASDRRLRGGDVTVDELAAHCAERLVAYKRPARVALLDALPLTPVGKVDKALLRAWARGA